MSCWRYGRALALEMISCGREDGSMRWNMGAFFCIGERKKLSLQEMWMNIQCFPSQAPTTQRKDTVLVLPVRD